MKKGHKTTSTIYIVKLLYYNIIVLSILKYKRARMSKTTPEKYSKIKVVKGGCLQEPSSN